MSKAEYYRADGVKITHNPYAEGMAEKYGTPGCTDHEGFDPYADSVGAGIYGGVVKRDSKGNVVIGEQYQNHNPRPGPVYAGGGYTPVSTALKSLPQLSALLDKYPDLVNDVSTGGAQPLHMCGMSSTNQKATTLLVARGADIEAVDTYGYTPLHRMASNNLAVGAKALLRAGADPSFTGANGQTPMQVARESRAFDVIAVLQAFPKRIASEETAMSRVLVSNTEFKEVNAEYIRTPGSSVPVGFGLVCKQQGWDTNKMWKKLGGGEDWFGADNGAYIYFNHADRHWWIDEPSGNGVYKAAGPEYALPAVGWKLLSNDRGPNPRSPAIQVYRGALP